MFIEVWGGVTVFRECDSHQRGVKGIRNVEENMMYFLKLTLPQYYFNHSFLQQAFTRKSKNSCRFKKFQEYLRFCKHLRYSWKFLNLNGLLDFLVKACWYWLLEYSRISMKFQAYS